MAYDGVCWWCGVMIYVGNVVQATHAPVCVESSGVSPWPSTRLEPTTGLEDTSIGRSSAVGAADAASGVVGGCEGWVWGWGHVRRSERFSKKQAQTSTDKHRQAQTNNTQALYSSLTVYAPISLSTGREKVAAAHCIILLRSPLDMPPVVRWKVWCSSAVLV